VIEQLPSSAPLPRTARSGIATVMPVSLLRRTMTRSQDPSSSLPQRAKQRQRRGAPDHVAALSQRGKCGSRRPARDALVDPCAPELASSQPPGVEHLGQAAARQHVPLESPKSSRPSLVQSTAIAWRAAAEVTVDRRLHVPATKARRTPHVDVDDGRPVVVVALPDVLEEFRHRPRRSAGACRARRPAHRVHIRRRDLRAVALQSNPDRGYSKRTLSALREL
jgi:hypothetical protein